MVTKQQIPDYAPCSVELPNGWSASIKVEDDTDMIPPWEAHDGHGPVRITRDAKSKRAGERVLTDGTGRYARLGDAYLYDFAEAVRIAKRDGWRKDADDDKRCAVCKRMDPPDTHDAEWNSGRTAVGLRHAFKPHTDGELAARAVEQDFERMRAWCNDEWRWVGVIVTISDAEGQEVDSSSVWGIESDTDYWREVASDLVNELAEGLVIPSYASEQEQRQQEQEAF